ncbi:uncharacterized protein I303_105720 [Kwoniella dejecticola CBS 10117]|uniref:N-acetyltransferase domain-containing protein n=1 Tax=Kwoniella dejecticola CBS 10117 TaxID=1296121 RepID=A0A1A6A073_9TREE|nr:uncharacterized protein I303_05741 [Kwoniella dejecticola CBS 10117]OBR83462.1 hypothetical protein I303_05741 [Kwoniella dejecticola CBS 10117]
MSTESARANLATFTIRIANEQQQIQHAKAGYDHWKKDNTYEQYWDLYLKERNQGIWGTDNKLLTWVLVRRDDPQGEIYAGCETYLRKGFVKHKGASSAVEDTYIYGIASVVTPKLHLRNGYATRLLALLHHQLSDLPHPSYSFSDSISLPSSIPLPKAIGSILWSDVGSTFYSRCTSSSDRPGWVVRDSQVTELVWKLLPPKTDQLDEGWEWLYLDDLPSIGSKLSKATKKNLAQQETTEKALFAHDPSSEGMLSFIPLKGTWQRPTIIDPEPVGLRYTPSGSAGAGAGGRSEEETIVLFSMKMINIGDRLLVTYVHNLTSAQLPSVLTALDILGHKAGQTEGWAWDISVLQPDLVDSWRNIEGREVKIGRRQEIDGHLLGAAWYGDLEEKGELVDGQMWSWC